MATPTWQPGTIYPPGALVRPRSTAPVDVGQPNDPGFESGLLDDWDWSTDGGANIDPTVQSVTKFAGTYALRWVGAAGTVEGGRALALVNGERAAVTPGQNIQGDCYILYNTGGFTPGSSGYARIYWYDAADVLLSITDGSDVDNSLGANRWGHSHVNGTAPPNAAFASMGAYLLSSGGDVYVDNFSWNYAVSGVPAGLIFKAVQDDAGYSDSVEPTWPTVLGNTVVDNEVTWEAVATSRVTWEATPILKSGSSEPTFPTLPGGNVVDNTIVWEAISRRVEDENCPNTKTVIIAASKIFAGDDDIIKFSATVNPLDWTSANDAGYLPFGLKTFGANPVAAMGLYRANLVAFNSQGFQMWQVDEDPANMAFLDAVPIGSTYPKTWVPVANDLAGLTAVGIRNIGIAGASTNLQADGVGEPIDPLVKAKIKELESDDDVLSLFWPATGQHWTIFGDEAFVLTVNAAKKKSWSRYVFPEAIVAWTLEGNTLVLRTETGKVWEMDDEVFQDDVYSVSDPLVLSGSNSALTNSLSWDEAEVGDENIAYYSLERSTGVGSTSFAEIAQIPGGDPREYDDEDLAQTTTYNYRVRAVDTSHIPNEYSNTVALETSTAMFVAVSSNGGAQQFATSPDAQTWSLVNSPAARLWGCVVWVQELGLFIASAYDAAGSGYTTRIATSPDGTTWTLRDAGVDVVLGGIAYSAAENRLIVSCMTSSATANAVTSTDGGVTWSTVDTTLAFNNCPVRAEELDEWLMLGTNGGSTKTANSSDGTAWSGPNTDPAAESTGVIYGMYVPEQNKYWFISAVGSSYTSTGGSAMTRHTFNAVGANAGSGGGPWGSMAWNGTIGVACSGGGNGTLYSSTDGQTWTSRLVSFAIGVTWSETLGLFVAVGTTASLGSGTGRCWTSPDGITWTQQTIANQRWRSVAQGFV